MATYEIVGTRPRNLPADVVDDLPPAEPGAVLFYDAHFWRVDAMEPAHSREADGRLILSPTADEPEAGAA